MDNRKTEIEKQLNHFIILEKGKTLEEYKKIRSIRNITIIVIVWLIIVFIGISFIRMAV